MGACINNACLPQRALTQETQTGVQIRVKRTGLERERDSEKEGEIETDIKRTLKARNRSGLLSFNLTIVFSLRLSCVCRILVFRFS